MEYFLGNWQQMFCRLEDKLIKFIGNIKSMNVGVVTYINVYSNNENYYYKSLTPKN